MLPEIDYELAAPPAASMVEALRGIGYNLQTAVADLVDNSISAGAKNVWLHFEWAGPDSWITITDDGRGMTEQVLADAMRPGSTSPLDDRSPEDLGRFGLGLKTASFSQCRRLTVVSKSNKSRPSTRRWDLDYVVATNEWRVLKSAAEGSSVRSMMPKRLESGTTVLWENLDRLVGDARVDDEHAVEAFHRSIDSVRSHLAMVFHRYMESSQAGIKLYINGAGKEHVVLPWDPFLGGNAKTSVTPEEPLTIGKARLVVQGFVLPHKDQLGEDAHRAAGSPDGWNERQGFYIYRNRRLLVPGSWLDLGWTKEEHYKLARIRVDIPNSMDTEWKIDVKKSTARPPNQIRKRLRELGEAVRRDAKDVFSHRATRGKNRQKEPEVRVWKEVQLKGRAVYQVNREHPIVVACLVRGAEKIAISRMIRVLEETVPVHKIWLDIAETGDTHGKPFQTAAEGEVAVFAKEVYCALRTVRKLSEQGAKEYLHRLEPFNSFPHLVEALLDDCTGD